MVFKKFVNYTHQKDCVFHSVTIELDYLLGNRGLKVDNYYASDLVILENIFSTGREVYLQTLHCG